MHQGARVAVVMPAFEEASHITRALSGMPALVDRIIVVDDASTDGTGARAAAVGDARVEVVRHRRNRGVGAAIATGYRAAFAQGPRQVDVAAVMAADAQMDPVDLPALLDPVVRGEAEYAKGNRLAWPDARRQMPLSRWIGNHALSWLTRRATGLSVHDSQCGYTALSRHAAARIDLDRLWPRYGYPNDLLGALHASGARVRDVRVRPVYAGEDSGVGLHHALFVVPAVIGRVAVRSALRSRDGAAGGYAALDEAYPEATGGPTRCASAS
ncbi:MAG: glycosyltransferase family 2 protein [Myxococcales bacterium]|nr:glycosyltransferase family 2 protein [Myxococcales bacterium]